MTVLKDEAEKALCIEQDVVERPHHQLIRTNQLVFQFYLCFAKKDTPDVCNTRLVWLVWLVCLVWTDINRIGRPDRNVVNPNHVRQQVQVKHMHVVDKPAGQHFIVLRRDRQVKRLVRRDAVDVPIWVRKLFSELDDPLIFRPICAPKHAGARQLLGLLALRQVFGIG